MNLTKLNKQLKNLLEGYPDFGFADDEYQIDCNSNSYDDPAYHMIEVNGNYAVFAAWFTGSEYETEKKSPWFPTQNQAMEYYYKELSDEPYDDGNYDDTDEDDWLADEDLDESLNIYMNFKSLNESLKKVTTFLYESEEEDGIPTEQNVEDLVLTLNNILKKINLKYIKKYTYSSYNLYYMDFPIKGQNFQIWNIPEIPTYLNINNIINYKNLPHLLNDKMLMSIKNQIVTSESYIINKDLAQFALSLVQNYSNLFSEVNFVSGQSIELYFKPNVTDQILKINKLLKNRGLTCQHIFPNTKPVRGTNRCFIPAQCQLSILIFENCNCMKFKFRYMSYNGVKKLKNSIKSYLDTNINSIINNLQQLPQEKPDKKVNWYTDGDILYCKTKQTGITFNDYGKMVQVQIVRADEWETGEFTDFEHAFWFPQVEPYIYDMSEGNEYDITPNQTGHCSLQDALKAIKNIGVTPPKYTTLVNFLKGIESWAETGTLDAYLQKHEQELKEMCS